MPVGKKHNRGIEVEPAYNVNWKKCLWNSWYTEKVLLQNRAYCTVTMAHAKKTEDLENRNWI